jgi:predicted small lipoprotein YifL
MVLLVGLAACGQKGPLKLAKPASAAAPASSPVAQ